MKFDNTSLDKLREDMTKLLESYGIQHDINFQVGKISYSQDYANIGIKAYVKDNTNNIDGKKSEFERNSRVIGASPDWFGKRAMLNGKWYTVSGINTRARKYPVILSCDDGTSVKSTIESVRRNLNP
jgi:hypothetical protein